MSASRLTASMLRMSPMIRSVPSAAVRSSQRVLPCTCQASSAPVLARRLQSTSTTATSNPSTAAAASTSTSPLNQQQVSPASTSAPLSETARVAQESFRRHQSRARPLPVIKDQKKLYLGVAVFAITAWSFFVLWAMSAEKAASSVVRTLLFNLRASEIVKDALGEGVRPKPFLLGNEPWVHGKVNTIQGIVDISFRVESDSGREGTLYFKSERRTKHGRFETIDFKLVVDGNPAQVIDLKNADLLGLNPV